VKEAHIVTDDDKNKAMNAIYEKEEKKQEVPIPKMPPFKLGLNLSKVEGANIITDEDKEKIASL
jgi:hypothetical protein